MHIFAQTRLLATASAVHGCRGEPARPAPPFSLRVIVRRDAHNKWNSCVAIVTAVCGGQGTSRSEGRRVGGLTETQRHGLDRQNKRE